MFKIIIDVSEVVQEMTDYEWMTILKAFNQEYLYEDGIKYNFINLNFENLSESENIIKQFSKLDLRIFIRWEE